jgi:hypothetical protein
VGGGVGLCVGVKICFAGIVHGGCAARITAMKNELASLLRHSLTALAGIGGLLAARGCIQMEDAPAVDAAGLSMVEGIVVVVMAIVARVLISVMGKIGATKKVANSGGSLPLVALTGALLSLVTAASLSSCAGVDMDGRLFYLHEPSGAQAGLVFDGEKPRGYVMVPILDRDGNEIGRAEIGAVMKNTPIEPTK